MIQHAHSYVRMNEPDMHKEHFQTRLAAVYDRWDNLFGRHGFHYGFRYSNTTLNTGKLPPKSGSKEGVRTS